MDVMTQELLQIRRLDDDHNAHGLAEFYATEFARLTEENARLREALRDLLEIAPKAWDSAMCHNGITTREKCAYCSVIDRAAALVKGEAT